MQSGTPTDGDLWQYHASNTRWRHRSWTQCATDGGVTAAGLALLDDADDAAQRTTLGLGATDTNTNAVFYPLFVSAIGGTVYYVDATTTPLSYNPSTGEMSMRRLKVGATTTYVSVDGPQGTFLCTDGSDTSTFGTTGFDHNGVSNASFNTNQGFDFTTGAGFNFSINGTRIPTTTSGTAAPSGGADGDVYYRYQ
jgi:hypothetical protein